MTAIVARVELTDPEAEALAQLVKRITFESVRRHAVDDGETYLMLDAIGKLTTALAEEGYKPR